MNLSRGLGVLWVIGEPRFWAGIEPSFRINKKLGLIHPTLTVGDLLNRDEDQAAFLHAGSKLTFNRREISAMLTESDCLGELLSAHDETASR